MSTFLQTSYRNTLLENIKAHRRKPKEFNVPTTLLYRY